MNPYSVLRPVILGCLFGIFFAAGSLAFDCDLHKQAKTATIDAPLYELSYVTDLEDGRCWGLNGKSDGYPTRMWMLATDDFGSYYVDTAIQEDVDAAVEQVMSGGGTALDRPSGVGGGAITFVLAAFCDGVILP